MFADDARANSPDDLNQCHKVITRPTIHNRTQTRMTRTPAFWGYPLPPHDYPYHWVILDLKSKENKVKVTNLKNSPKFQIFEFWNGHYMRHTFWSCLIRCANMKWIWWVFLKIQSGHDSVHRQTDGQGDTSIPPFQLHWSGGYNQVIIHFSYGCMEAGTIRDFFWVPDGGEHHHSCIHHLKVYYANTAIHHLRAKHKTAVSPVSFIVLTHWVWASHICVGKLTIIGSDNGLSPCRRQAIIWTSAGILLIGPLGINFSEILIGIQRFSFKKIHLKMSSGKWRPFCLGLNVLRMMALDRLSQT